MSAIDDLRRALARHFANEPLHWRPFYDAPGMGELLAELRQRHGGHGIDPTRDRDRIAQALAYFWQHGVPDSPLGLKYVCYAAAHRDGNNPSLLDVPARRQTLFELVRQSGEWQKRRCIRGLLHAYWTHPLPNGVAAAAEGWYSLRQFLAQAVHDLGQMQHQPEWLQTLCAHQNMLGDDPCGSYGQRLLAGDSTEFDDVAHRLGIPLDSWVYDEAYLAQMRAAADMDDAGFKEHLDRLLVLLTGPRQPPLSEILRKRCMGVLVSRYARCGERPEHSRLRDAAVQIIGNPWLRVDDWHAWVRRQDGQPDEEARQMVNGWLKRRLITDFFALLSQDRQNDQRRLAYWLRFEPLIEDMWFALGRDAANRGGPHAEFRQRAQGRWLELGNAQAENNAFIMKIGNIVAVEFGVTGNACYLYQRHALPGALQALFGGNAPPREIGAAALRDRDLGQQAIHMDSPSELWSWEQKFDRAIHKFGQPLPPTRAAFVPALEDLVRQHGLLVEDRRPEGGALRVLTNDQHQLVNRELRALGFTYHRGPAGSYWYRE